ncbi:MAG: PIN domain-containing protein, partial [Pollutimonas bauzanensis]
MPLPKLPTRMGAMISPVAYREATAAPALAEAPVTTEAPAPQARRQAPAKPSGAPLVLPAPEAPALAVVASRPAKKTRLPVAKRKLFVLDTNVLLHDSNSLFKFEEHDIFLPMIVLEELDHQKKGMSEVARNARQVSRFLDGLVGSSTELDKGVELDALGNVEALGKLHFQTTAMHSELPIELPMGKADNVILNVVHALQAVYPKRAVVLVSKDINMRLKARSLGLPAEDYLNDHVLDDSDLLYDGVMPLPENFWLKHGKDVESWQQGGTTYYRIKGPLCSEFIVNEFVYFDGELPLRDKLLCVSGRL